MSSVPVTLLHFRALLRRYGLRALGALGAGVGNVAMGAVVVTIKELAMLARFAFSRFAFSFLRSFTVLRLPECDGAVANSCIFSYGINYGINLRSMFSRFMSSCTCLFSFLL